MAARFVAEIGAPDQASPRSNAATKNENARRMIQRALFPKTKFMAWLS